MEPEKTLQEAGQAQLPSPDSSAPAIQQNEHPATTDPLPDALPNETEPMSSPVPAASEAENSEPQEHNTPDTTEPPASETPNSWWDDFQFEGKEFSSLRSDGMLMLQATVFSPERPLQMMRPETAQAIVNALREKFKDEERKVRELASEWALTEDKHKLSSRVEMIRDHLMRAQAVGDFIPLFRQVGLWDSQLQEGVDKAYEARRTIIERAEALAQAGGLKKEDLNEMRELGENLKHTGYVDKDRADALRLRFEAARDSFYNHRRELQETERAELQSNLDLKTELVEKIEKLAQSENWKEATQQCNDLLEEWKKTGRTFHEKNENLWQRFIAARHLFFERKKLHFEEIQTEQEQNLSLKCALVERAEKLSDSTDWNKTSDDYALLMDEWKSIGRVPAEKTEEIWNRLNAAKDTFYNAKRSHFAALRVTHDDNLVQKEAIVKRAESLQNSTDWRGTTEELTELMEAWKKVGPVARREQNEALWRAFNKARHNFFHRKDEDRDRRRAHMENNRAGRLAQVQDFLAQLKTELKEFEEDLADHHASLANLGNSKIDQKIRANLEQLIAQAAPKMEKKQAKIAEVAAQLEGLKQEQKQKNKATLPAPDKPSASEGLQDVPSPEAESASAPETAETLEPETE
ncbi:MAG: DUF349 domain-containing protein [Bacteroidetes bacterium]|nr:DUF349 domain-containing protein [Bacteroidota bacterium]MBS1630926.1 DUF349 domain-containing protein [Bacteroidota bacterium]